ncbi:MAG TPA: hypothetical protein VGJ20_43380 [Xanthobacteraceae bacterium]|jgi:hypothetical protein
MSPERQAQVEAEAALIGRALDARIAFAKIAEGLTEAIAIARGKATPARVYIPPAKPGGQRQAFDLDHDLAAQGETQAEAADLLEQALAAYVDTADLEPEPTRTDLLRQAMPLWARLRLALRQLERRVRKSR